MRTVLFSLILLALAGCVTVRRQTAVIGAISAPGCNTATVNGKSGNACFDCLLCPKGQRCWSGSDIGFLQQCPRVK